MTQRRTYPGAAAIVIVAALLCGCDREDGRDPPAAQRAGQSGKAGDAAASQGAGMSASGVIRGKVKFTGTKPAAKPVERECHPGVKVTIPDEAYLVGPGGELKNAVVFLKNPPAGSAVAAPAAPVIDQKDCVYVPHVVAAQVGQRVTFTSSDKVLHNVHVVARDNGESNQSMNFGERRELSIKGAEFFTAKCDLHPWMTCKVAAFDHPFYAVTGDDGSFAFNGLPPGTYTVGVWHEKLGQRSQDVAVAADRPAELVITIEKK
jgi:plastocyanin